jgi:hypothetical protein
MNNPYSKHRGPHPGIVATVYVVLFFTNLCIVLSGGASFPRPGDPLEKTAAIIGNFTDVFRWSAFLQFGAAIPLLIFTAAVTSRLSFLGVNVTGVSIALAGGIIASGMSILSAASGWILSQPGMAANLAVMHAVQLLGFVTGGIAYSAGMGLLMAGVSVPCLFGRYTPRWLAWLGLIVGAIAELSSLYLIAPQVALLLPIARFGSYVWMIGTGFTLVKKPIPARTAG